MCKRILIKSLFVISLLGLLCQPVPAQSSNLRVNGTVYFMSGRIAGRSLPFSLIVNRYSSAGEVAELNEGLQRGEDQLLRTLSRMSAGRIQIGTGVGLVANAIIAVPWENGTRLTVLYERNVTFFELRYGRRSADYRFGYAELFLDQRGRGQGTLIGAAKVKMIGGNTWEVEDFGTFPARLMGLRASGEVRAR
jgi:hypothetical protein